MLRQIKNALISVSDKDELLKILKILDRFKVKIISSGGTYKQIIKLGYKCEEISKYAPNIEAKLTSTLIDSNSNT